MWQEVKVLLMVKHTHKCQKKGAWKARQATDTAGNGHLKQNLGRNHTVGEYSKMPGRRQGARDALPWTHPPETFINYCEVYNFHGCSVTNMPRIKVYSGGKPKPCCNNRAADERRCRALRMSEPPHHRKGNEQWLHTQQKAQRTK